MKIIHVYAKNIDIFVDAVKDTDCKLNASSDIDYMLDSLSNFNARDVMGLVVFANPMTKKCVRLIERFDELFVFHKMPIVVVSDCASELWNTRKIRVKNSKVFVLDSEDNSISDLDISSIFTTLIAYSDTIYDLSGCSHERRITDVGDVASKKELTMSEQLTGLLEYLKGGESNATGRTEQEGA